MGDQELGIAGRVIEAAGRGAVGAVVGAALSAGTEPIVNRVLVKRIPLMQAIDEVKVEDMTKFFQTTLPTNFIKFPFFEAVNVIMQFIPVSPAMRGTVTGIVFTTTTLPITNYRYRKSMDMPIEFGNLYQAYVPTVLRDIVYGIVRNKVTESVHSSNPEFAATNAGKFFNMFITVFISCIVSAPGNEYRGYCLQPKDRQLSFGEFFQPVKFIRSTSIGATIMGTALACGAIATPQAQKLVDIAKKYMESNPLAYVIVLLFLIHQKLESSRRAQDVEHLKRK